MKIVLNITFSVLKMFANVSQLHDASLARAYFRLVGCSDCCRLFIFFTNILKIIVFLFCSIKISRIFVKEITTKTKQNGNYNEISNRNLRTLDELFF